MGLVASLVVGFSAGLFGYGLSCVGSVPGAFLVRQHGRECWGSGPIPNIAFPFLPPLMLYSKMLISSGFTGVRSKIMVRDPTHLSVLKVLQALMVARAGAGMCIRKHL